MSALPEMETAWQGQQAWTKRLRPGSGTKVQGPSQHRRTGQMGNCWLFVIGIVIVLGQDAPHGGHGDILEKKEGADEVENLGVFRGGRDHVEGRQYG
jgi:hypothetical protein